MDLLLSFAKCALLVKRYKISRSFKKSDLKKISPFFWVIFLCLLLTAPFLSDPVKFPDSESPIVFYSNQLNSNLKGLFCSAMKGANHSLYVDTYSLSDEDVIDLLKEKADQVETHLSYDSHATPPLPKANWELDVHKTSGLMHRKILVVDKKRTYLGSANLTSASLRLHENLCVGFYSSELSEFFAKKTAPFASFLIHDQKIDAYLMPEDKKRALHDLIQQIDLAKKRIFISIFTFTHPELLKAVISAKERGVKVDVAIDAYNAAGSSQKVISSLEKAKVPIYSHHQWQLFHNKWAVIDDVLVTGSANWTIAGFTKNKECFIILSPLTEEQKKFFRSIKKIIRKNSQSLFIPNG